MGVKHGTAAGLAVGVALLVGAQLVRREVEAARARWPETVDTPYAPSPAATPYVALGYTELAADLFWIRTRIYVGSPDDTADGVRGLVEAVVAADPSMVRAYELGATWIQWVDGGHTVEDLVWSVDLLERAMTRFPDRWQLPYQAGQIYVLDLLEHEDDPRHAAWRERGLELLEHAIRTPGAPQDLATRIAHERTQMGQLDRAARDLEELILTTHDAATRQKLVDKLAELRDESAEALADEAEAAIAALRRAHRAALPETPVEMYLLLGDPPTPYIDFAELAVERELVGVE